MINPTPMSYWRNCHDGDSLYCDGVAPMGQAIQMQRIAVYAREASLRRMARQAVVRWGLGELIGERRGMTG